MKVVKFLRLERPARKAGGDRYETEDGKLVIYVPQDISRERGAPFLKLKITFED